MRSIGEVATFCHKCGWVGTVETCEPDVDGDGSLGCPECNSVVESLLTDEEKKMNDEKKSITGKQALLILFGIFVSGWSCGAMCVWAMQNLSISIK